MSGGSRIVFLDFDGVLLPIGACTNTEVGLVRSAPMLHVSLLVSRVPKEARDAVQELCVLGEAKIVVISSWRYAFSRSFIEHFLLGCGLALHLHYDWLAEFRFSSSKADDIGFWMADHDGIDGAIAIDDWDLGPMRSPLVRQVVPARASVGLTRADLAKSARRWPDVELLQYLLEAEGAKEG